MNEIINVIFGLVVIAFMGAFATFFVIMNYYKEEIWNEIYKIMNGGDDNE